MNMKEQPMKCISRPLLRLGPQVNILWNSSDSNYRCRGAALRTARGPGRMRLFKAHITALQPLPPAMPFHVWFILNVACCRPFVLLCDHSALSLNRYCTCVRHDAGAAVLVSEDTHARTQAHRHLCRHTHARTHTHTQARTQIYGCTHTNTHK